MIATQPAADEYAPYYGKYISLVNGPDPIAALDEQFPATLALLAGLSDAQAEQRYAPGKWSIKEVVGHIMDTERVFAYRALRIGRGDRTPLAGFEQDDYVSNAGFDRRRIADLAAEFADVRRATLALLRGLDQAAWTRRGIANNKEVSVRALAYIIAGHERHHVGILQTRYLDL